MLEAFGKGGQFEISFLLRGEAEVFKAHGSKHKVDRGQIGKGAEKEGRKKR
jgi:hypothetical protein